MEVDHDPAAVADRATAVPDMLFDWAVLPTRGLPATLPMRLLRQTPSDFRVDEIPSYTPGGEGPHLMVRVEKVGVSTQEVARRICAAAGVDGREVGFAGRKDVRAVATQWFSVPASNAAVASLVADAELGPHVRILESGRHRNKLQLGHLRGNRFTLMLSGSAEAVAQMQARAGQVAAGVPNYFGPQRFGFERNNAVVGYQLLTGKQRGRDRRTASLMVSALQSHVFNHVLAARLRKDPALAPMAGDLMCKLLNGALFPCEDPAVDAPRVAAGEVSPTGPLPGVKMRTPGEGVLTLESQVTAAVVPDPTWFARARHAPRGDRRPLLLVPSQVALTPVEGGAQVSFGLPSGAFATAVLREWCGVEQDGGEDP